MLLIMFSIHVSVTLYMQECFNNVQLIFFFFLHVNVNYVVIYLNSFYTYYI